MQNKISDWIDRHEKALHIFMCCWQLFVGGAYLYDGNYAATLWVWVATLWMCCSFMWRARCEDWRELATRAVDVMQEVRSDLEKIKQ